jgi:uncharacterized protein (DUF1697 family)
VTDHPFDGDPASDPTKHYVTFLNAAPKQADVDALVVPREERGRYWVKGREIYQWMPTGRGQTKLDNAFFEKRLGVVGTGRNWRTVTALDALAREVDDG